MSDKMTSAEIISQRLKRIEEWGRITNVEGEWLIQTVREMTAALDFNKRGLEAIHSDGFKHLTAWQKSRDALDRAAGKENGL